MDSIKLLKSYFKGEKLKFEGDFNEELKKQNEQSLAPFLYFVYGDVFRKVYLGLVLIQEKFYKIQSYITKLFNENNIDHFYTKGSIVSKYYPDSALRTRGDIDVLVKEEEFEKAKEILLNNGFKFYEVASHHIELKYNGMLIELHKELYEKSKRDYEYFKDCFDHTIRVDKNYCELDINYHYLYLLSHFNRHLVIGEGLRYLLDFYYVSKNCNLDYDYINKELDKLGLRRLHESVINAIYELTNEWILEVDRIDVSDFLKYMEECGIHSRCEKGIDKGLINHDGSKLKRGFSQIFLTDKELRQACYPKLSKHWYLYPILLVRRIFFLITRRWYKLLKLLATNKKELDKIKQLQNQYGIIKTRKED